MRIVYSPLDCLTIAEQNPARTVVFFAVGFETTAPANAMAVWQARRRGLKNFAVLVSHVLVPPAMTAILELAQQPRAGFPWGPATCAPSWALRSTSRSRTGSASSIVITGFEPLDLLEGIYRCVQMLEEGRHGVENQYVRAVHREPNAAALRLIRDVFELTDRKWRGIGTIPRSGFRLSPAYAEFDAQQRFAVEGICVAESAVCIQRADPPGSSRSRNDCSAFGKTCTPQNPLGATMVSSEGARAAYYHYGRFRHPAPAAAAKLETVNA